MLHRFHFKTSDPEAFQDAILPLAGSSRVRPAKGCHFDISIRAARLDKLRLFVVNAPSVKVHIAPPHDYFCLNVPLGKPFSIAESNQTCGFSDDVHLLLPERALDLEAASECRVLAVKLDSERVFDHAFKLSGGHRAIQSGANNRLSHSARASRALVQDIARFWSDLQREDTPLPSGINVSEREDALITRFVLAMQGDEGVSRRPGRDADTSYLARAEEYLRARLTQPVSRAELAAATGVSIRTLSRGFAKRWGTGPMGFLRSQRLHAAYRELLGAPPEATSVTEVACRYGFTHLGMFAKEYKRAFKELPSETLRY